MSYNGISPTRYSEPPQSRTSRGVAHGRWRWWYSAIADCMIAHPDWTQNQIATHLNKHPNTISMLVNTDLFREYLAQRKASWREDHDHALRSRMTEVATEGLDIVLEHLKTKRASLNLQTALKVVESSLDRLGYAPQSGPQVVVDNRQIDARQQTVTCTPADLEAARAAMRMAEQSKTGSSLAPSLDKPSVLEACGVGRDVIDVEASEGQGP